MPQMNDVIEGWTCEIMTNQRRQMLQDGIITNVDTFVKMRGVIQPLKAEDIALKPEEQRSWAWYEIHVTNNFDVLKNNQVIYIDKRPYKIMARKDYSRNGFRIYHIIEDFTANEN